MKDPISNNKAYIITFLVTSILILGGIFILGKSNKSPKTSENPNSSLLISENSHTTSGILDGAYLSASDSAKVTLVEFGDYECPACAIYGNYIIEILKENAGKINYVFRNYPIPSHKNSLVAAYAVEAAGVQAKYWEMHDKIYSSQSEWSDSNDPKTIFVNYAKEFELDTTKFASDMNSSEIKNKVEKDYNDGNSVGLTQTPTFYLNGVKMDPQGSYEDFKTTIEREINK